MPVGRERNRRPFDPDARLARHLSGLAGRQRRRQSRTRGGLDPARPAAAPYLERATRGGTLPASPAELG